MMSCGYYDSLICFGSARVVPCFCLYQDGSQIVGKYMGVNEHERLYNITLR
jgi:hypothetical protein